mmetsp:Transcript_86202/g.238997  ORF Transcript_86202/g.238997 Transcript_86202/m.238997 type:complete len:1117 (-) Transcript_86202:109-3459(-)
MGGDALRQKQVPWCTIFLVIGATICHILVLIGNCKTADAMNELGVSTGGWARVGKGVARSLQIELDHDMHEVSTWLVEGLGQLSFVQDSLDNLMVLIDNATGNFISEPQDLSALPNKAVSLLQKQHEVRDPSVSVGLALVIGDAIHRALTAIVGKVSLVLRQFLEVIRPALVRMGDWIIRFGDRIQAGITVFSITLDRVQKLFDQIMSQLAGHGENEQAMLDATFALFDVSNTGYVTVTDLKEVASLYRITALQGRVPQDLVDMYDATGDGRLTKDELALLVNDATLPDLMSLVLRTYAKRLAEIGGNAAAARHRDEVALAVVDYFALVCAKNPTKVRWVSDSLGNGSLPLSFTADVMAQLCLTEDSPDRLTTTGVGATIVKAMHDLHPEQTLEALHLMMNTSFWAAEGFHVNDQPRCVHRVMSWIIRSRHLQTIKSRELESAEAVSVMDEAAIFELLSDTQGRPLASSLLETIPARMQKLTHEGVAAYLLQRRRERPRLVREMHSVQTLRFKQTSGLGGSSGGGDGIPSVAERTIMSGQRAAPETLEFAQWLATNATQNAVIMHDMCFAYSSESSNVLDSFAAQIQQMLSQIQAFLDVMMKYATPTGIQRLETQIEDFERKALAGVATLIEKKLFMLVNGSLPTLEHTVRQAVHRAGEWLGHRAGNLIEGPLGGILVEPLTEYLSTLVSSDKAGRLIGEVLGPELAQFVANLTSDTLADGVGYLLEALVERALAQGFVVMNTTVDHAVDDILQGVDSLIPGLAYQQEGLAGILVAGAERQRRAERQLGISIWPSHKSPREFADGSLAASALGMERATAFQGDSSILEAMKSRYAGEIEADDLSGTWESMVRTVQSLADVLPMSVRTVKFARREVSRVYSNLDAIFSVFDERGKQLFNTLAQFWRTLWILYFCSLLPLNCYILYYGFWAGGFFGGPTPLPPDEERTVVPPKTFKERLSLCIWSCSMCMKQYHDTQLCFWSAIMLLQVIVLVVFVISVALCALAGIKAFILAGCAELYVLGDETVCTDQLSNIKHFLSTFVIADAMEPLYGACGGQKLLTCHLIRRQMIVSSAFTTVFSFVGTLICLELIISSAVIHEQARWRRLASSVLREEEEDV